MIYRQTGNRYIPNLQILFMLKQQHYTLTNVKKSEIAINHPFKNVLISVLQVWNDYYII